MANQLGPIEVQCDAPPYAIVRACQWLGFQTPEDVRWCRIDHFLEAQADWRVILQCQPWQTSDTSPSPAEKCSCGTDLPQLQMFTFTLTDGRELSYLLGQCCRCRAMFWERS